MNQTRLTNFGQHQTRGDCKFGAKKCDRMQPYPIALKKTFLRRGGVNTMCVLDLPPNKRVAKDLRGPLAVT